MIGRTLKSARRMMGEEVICYCGNKDYPEYYGDIYILTFYTDTGWLLGDAVTHWMPKPKPPEVSK